MDTRLGSSLLAFTFCALALAGCPGSKDEPVAPPAAPTGLTATPFNGAAGLAWSASVGATTYNVYRSATAGQQPAAMTLVASGIGSTSFNAQAANDSLLYYRVTAVNSGGESAASNEASATALATLLPAIPRGVTATPGDRTVTLAWDDVPAATSYNVYWRTTPGVTTGDLSFACASSPCAHTSLTNGQDYYYAVVALISASESALSAEVTASPAALPYIEATAISMVAGSLLGLGTYVVKVCTTSACTTPIGNATVSLGGTALVYDGIDTYAGEPSASIAGVHLTLVVTIPSGGPVLGGTFTTGGTMYTHGPTLTSPTQGATWMASAANTFTWSGASSTTSSMYSVSAFNLSPFDIVIGMVAPPATSFAVAANTMSPGSWTAVAQIISTAKIPIPNTLAGSGLTLAASSATVTFTVQ